jgi:hypothetical protein
LRGGKNPEKKGMSAGCCFLHSNPLCVCSYHCHPYSHYKARKKLNQRYGRKKGEAPMNQSLEDHHEKKRKCIECGKNMNLFEGYKHPTMGIHFLICRNCFEKVENSVERWGRFVLWNSFNPDAPDPTFIDNFPFPRDEFTQEPRKIRHHKHFHFIIY